MKLKNFLILLTIVLFLSACGQVGSLDINPDIIKTDYSAEYEEGTGILKVSGSFTVGGNNSTYVDLQDPSYFKIDGKLAKRTSNLANQIFYVENRPITNSNTIGILELNYYDSLERSFINYISIPSKISFMSKSKVEKDEDLIVYYQIDDLNDGASSTYISISSENESNQILVPSWDVSGDHTFSYADLKMQFGDKVTIQTCRSKRVLALNNPGEGGHLSSSYCSATKEVIIE